MTRNKTFYTYFEFIPEKLIEAQALLNSLRLVKTVFVKIGKFE